MKVVIRLYLACLFCLSGVGSLIAEELRLDQKIAVDVEGEDATFQIVKGMESSGKLLCLWNGDVLEAIVSTRFESFEGDEAAYLKRTLSGMKAQNVKKIKSEEGGSLRTGSGIEFQAYTVRAKQDEQDSVQLMYFAKLEEGIEFVLFTLQSPEFLNDVKSRADKVIRSSALLER